MTDPQRENWPQKIAELEAAGISAYKLGQMLRPVCQVGQVKRWANPERWSAGTEPSHWLGEQIKTIYAEYVLHAVPAVKKLT